MWRTKRVTCVTFPSKSAKTSGDVSDKFLQRKRLPPASQQRHYSMQAQARDRIQKARLVMRRAIMVVRVCPLDASKKGGEGQMHIVITVSISIPGTVALYFGWRAIERKRR